MEQRHKLAELFADLWRVHVEWASCHIISTVQVELNLCNRLIGNQVQDQELQDVLIEGRLSYDQCHTDLIKSEKALRAYLLNQDLIDDGNAIEEDMKSIVCSASMIKSTETTTIVSLSLNAVATKAYETLFNMSFLTDRNSLITGLSSPRTEILQTIWDIVGPSLITIIESIWEHAGIDNSNNDEISFEKNICQAAGE